MVDLLVEWMEDPPKSPQQPHIVPDLNLHTIVESYHPKLSSSGQWNHEIKCESLPKIHHHHHKSHHHHHHRQVIEQLEQPEPEQPELDDDTSIESTLSLMSSTFAILNS